MSLNLKVFLIIAEVLFFIIIVYNIREKKLLLKYSLLWLAAVFAMAIGTVFPQILQYICDLLGIELISNLVFLIGWLILVVLTFALTIIVSNQKRKIILLVEEVGILHKKIGEKNDKKLNK